MTMIGRSSARAEFPLSLAAIAYRAWGQLHWAPPLNRGWIAVAALIGVVHVAVLLIGGLVGGMASVRSEFDWLVYLENTWYVGTLLLGVETARTYLFHVWFRRSPVAAWATTVLLFFVVVTPYAQFQSLDSFDRAVEIAGASLIPALAISVLATWFAEQGGMGASLA